MTCFTASQYVECRGKVQLHLHPSEATATVAIAETGVVWDGLRQGEWVVVASQADQALNSCCKSQTSVVKQLEVQKAERLQEGLVATLNGMSQREGTMTVVRGNPPVHETAHDSCHCC